MFEPHRRFVRPPVVKREEQVTDNTTTPDWCVSFSNKCMGEYQENGRPWDSWYWCVLA